MYIIRLSQPLYISLCQCVLDSVYISDSYKLCISLCASVYQTSTSWRLCARYSTAPTNRADGQTKFVCILSSQLLLYFYTHAYLYNTITHTQRKADTTAWEGRQTKLVHYLCTKDIAFKTMRRDPQYKNAPIGQSELSVALM